MPPKQALEDAIAALSARLDKVSASWEQRHDSLAAVLSDIQLHLTSRPPLPSPVSATGPSMFPPLPASPLFSLHPAPFPQLKPPKLLFQPFDGFAPFDWLFQAEQYFSFYQIPSAQWLSMISFYMKGDALNWFKWMYANHQLSLWRLLVVCWNFVLGPRPSPTTRLLCSSFVNGVSSPNIKLSLNGFVIGSSVYSRRRS
ncbi:UNVERIFIED_CONTAM: hypothetical protein Sradi_2378000 [Sesamum radiatum]|uniref:Retrotransposon gag domain-containing protein n=1 Tax=Sesamum radiatum TaxID=300843 RepID=A0AAW2T751_SESRA